MLPIALNSPSDPKPAKNDSPPASSASAPSLDAGGLNPRERQAQIARRALSKAQARGFSGRTLADWRDAEAEFEAEMAARDWALARDFARTNDLLPRDFRPSDQD